MSTPATRQSAILSIKRLIKNKGLAYINSNIFRKILQPIPEIEEQNFKNKVKNERLVQLDGNIWYQRNRDRRITRNGIRNKFYVKKQGPKENSNIHPSARNQLKGAINIHYHVIPAEEAAGRPASVRLLKQQLAAMMNDLRRKTYPIFIIPEPTHRSPTRRPPAENTARHPPTLRPTRRIVKRK